MQLSAPLYVLKRKARLLSRAENIPLHQALDRIAAQEGFTSWSLLASKTEHDRPAAHLFGELVPGDLLLLGARPQQGKTLLSVEIAVEAMKQRRRAYFFTLDLTLGDMPRVFDAVGAHLENFKGLFEFDGSDGICADYIVNRLRDAPNGSVVVVDYLQLLDQKRETPPLREQVQLLHEFVGSHGLIFVMISQVDRRYDPATKECPDLGDVRLPNAVDLSLFSKACFLQGGELRFQALSQRAA